MALAGGSFASAALLSACGDGAAVETSRFGDGDVGILNYALTLEHLEVALYASLAKVGSLQSKTETTLRKFGEEEEEHIAALALAVERLGGEPVSKPKTEFPAAGNAEMALKTASEIENLVAAAYLGQLSSIENEAALEAMLSIHSVEGQHAATLNSLLGEPVTPDGALAKPATAEAVLGSVEPFLVG